MHGIDKLELSYEEEQLLYPEEEEEHLGQTEQHFKTIYDIFNLLMYFFENKDVHIIHDIILYYEENNKEKCISPDIMVVKHPQYKEKKRTTYLLWRESAPNVVFEVVSKNTKDKDYIRNVNLFKNKIPINEYIIIDNISDTNPKITFYRYRDGKIIYKKTSQKVYSEELDMEITFEGDDVVFYYNGERLLDPKTDMKLKGEQIGIEKGRQEGEQIGIQKGEQIGIKKGEQIGIKKGERIKAIETAKKMLQKGFSIENIIDLTGLSKEDIDALK